MTASLWLRDIASFGLQLTVIIAAGAAIWRVLGVRQSTVTLAYWRMLLLACLLLPLGQPWRAASVASFENATLAAVEFGDPIEDAGLASPTPAAPAGTARSSWPSGDAVLALLGAGVIVRSLWLALGAGNLRRRRQAAVRLDPVPPAFRDAEVRVGAHADLYVSDQIAGPITFGLLRPVVMVPPSVLEMESELQDAIASHELLHVRRRDWLSVILEEVIRTLFWFHPAIWWLIGRIHLSREHVVDEAVIRLTQARERYVDALVAVALTRSPIALTPAPLFLRRRFLKRRIAHIFQETAMTTRRLIASVTVSAGALALAAVLAVRSFPLEAHVMPSSAPEQTTSQAPIQITQGAEHLLHGSLPEYPRRAIEKRVEGDVVLDVTVDDRGEVSDARVVSGPDELRRAALESVLQWHYSPESLRSTSTQVALQFRVPESSAEGRENAMRDPADGDRQKEEFKLKKAEAKRMMEKLRDADRQGRLPPFGGEARLVRIATERVPQGIVQEIRERAGVTIGDPITEATAKRIHEIASAVDEHLRVRFEGDGRGGVVLVIVAP